MGDKNPIRTHGDYSIPSHEGYLKTIELPDGKNVVPLRSDTNGLYLLLKSPSSWHQYLAPNPDFYDHVSFHLKRKIDCVTNIKLYDKNAEEFYEIIKNLSLYDHEGWNDSRDFIKPVKAISFPPNTSKTPDRRPLEMEDQIKFLLKGPQIAPRTSPTHIPQAYVKIIYSDPYLQNLNEPPRKNSFTFQKRGNMWELEDSIENRIDWNKPPKKGDEAWHAKIRLIDPNGEEFIKTFQSIPITRKLFEKENPSDVIDLDHFHDH
nr:hypothetical protein [Tanacetum cinerariifolium]